jgi:hypothetical protein
MSKPLLKFKECQGARSVQMALILYSLKNFDKNEKIDSVNKQSIMLHNKMYKRAFRTLVIIIIYICIIKLESSAVTTNNNFKTQFRPVDDHKDEDNEGLAENHVDEEDHVDEDEEDRADAGHEEDHTDADHTEGIHVE